MNYILGALLFLGTNIYRLSFYVLTYLFFSHYLGWHKFIAVLLAVAGHNTFIGFVLSTTYLFLATDSFILPTIYAASPFVAILLMFLGTHTTSKETDTQKDDNQHKAA